MNTVIFLLEDKRKEKKLNREMRKIIMPKNVMMVRKTIMGRKTKLEKKIMKVRKTKKATMTAR